jgi:hypothetical protein
MIYFLKLCLTFKKEALQTFINTLDDVDLKRKLQNVKKPDRSFINQILETYRNSIEKQIKKKFLKIIEENTVS